MPKTTQKLAARKSKAPLKAKTNNEKNWDEFLDWTAGFRTTHWLFRGHSNQNYTLTPSVGRLGDYSQKSEMAAFRMFRSRLNHASGASQPASELDILVMAQHHGMPTRLLDWTSSPLCAAFFACCDDSHKKTPSEPIPDAEIVAYKTRPDDYVNSGSLEEIVKLKSVQFHKPAYVIERVAAQRGFFSIHNEPTKPWVPHDERIRRFKIPSKARHQFMTRLYRLGIDHYAMYRGLDGLGKQIAWNLRHKIELWHTM